VQITEVNLSALICGVLPPLELKHYFSVFKLIPRQAARFGRVQSLLDLIASTLKKWKLQHIFFIRNALPIHAPKPQITDKVGKEKSLRYINLPHRLFVFI
jgi:hypothetical protein